jgi:hypothetical protein
MSKYCRVTIAAEVNLNDFEDKATARFKNTFGSAYAFGVHLLLSMTRLYLANTSSTHEDINILIEDGHRNSRQAIEQISDWKKKPGTILKVRSHGLGDKRNYPILQAADLAAYGWWQFRAGGDASIFSAVKRGAPRLKAMMLPWSNRSIEAINEGVNTNKLLREQGAGGKNFRDLALW